MLKTSKRCKLDLLTVVGAGLALTGFVLSIFAVVGKAHFSLNASGKGGFEFEKTVHQIIKHRRMFIASFCIIAAGMTLQFVAALIQ